MINSTFHVLCVPYWEFGSKYKYDLNIHDACDNSRNIDFLTNIYFLNKLTSEMCIPEFVIMFTGETYSITCETFLQ